MNNQHNQPDLLRTARLAGFWYLLMAISGVMGFLIFHPKIFISGDAQQTLNNLIDMESTARIRILLEFAIIVTQALTAVYFYKLFKGINDWAGWTLGIWGTVNSMIIMISGIAMGTALKIAGSTQMVMEEKVPFVELLSGISANAWAAGGLFFGLWLIPMGYIITSSKCMNVWLGRTLIIGGVGYLLSVVGHYSGIESSALNYLTIPATIGEFWIIGYLFAFGIKDQGE